MKGTLGDDTTAASVFVSSGPVIHVLSQFLHLFLFLYLKNKYNIRKLGKFPFQNIFQNSNPTILRPLNRNFSMATPFYFPTRSGCLVKSAH